MEVQPQKFGPYLVFEQIGSGGMATVHRAEQRTKDGSVRTVALKRLLSRAATRKDLVASFVHEGRLLRYLDHPNIAATYESGKHFGSYFIAMEYVPGLTLKELVQQCDATKHKLPTPITLGIALQLCEALDHAHGRCDERGAPLGIIHRDVSPANIILSDTGLVKLIDFGLAKAKVSSVDTGEHMIKGKFSYVAPEYLNGTLDARADLWAVGVVMYELLTSRPLFDAHDDLETMSRVRELPIPRPSRANPGVPRGLDDIVMTALQRDPARRWQTAAALRDALRGVIGEPGHAYDHAQVTRWVAWVFTQSRRRKDSSVLANLFAADALAASPPVDTAPAVAPRPSVYPVLRQPNLRWIAIGLAVALALAVVAIIVFARAR